MKVAVEVIGWIGAALILGAYAVLSTGRLRAESLTYQLMNILGAAGFVVNSGWNGALPSAAMNVIWMGIGIYALRQRRRLPVKAGCASLRELQPHDAGHITPRCRQKANGPEVEGERGIAAATPHGLTTSIEVESRSRGALRSKCGLDHCRSSPPGRHSALQTSRVCPGRRLGPRGSRPVRHKFKGQE